MIYANEAELFTALIAEALQNISLEARPEDGIYVYEELSVATDIKVKRPYAVAEVEETIFVPLINDDGSIVAKDAEQVFSIVAGFKSSVKGAAALRREKNRVAALIEAEIESTPPGEYEIQIPGFAKQTIKITSFAIIGKAAGFEDVANNIGECILAGTISFVKLN